MPLKHFFQLVFTKVSLNLKSEASTSYLSYLWWLLEPTLFVSVFFVVFGVFMDRGDENFVVFLVCGKIPYLWFARTINNSSGSVMAGRGLMNQIKIPKIFFPTVVILQDLVKSGVVFVLMMLFVWAMGFQPTIHWLSIPVLMLFQLLFVAVVAFFSAMLVPFLPDLRFIISTLVMMTMFASGIFYDYKELILPEHQSLFLSNPMALLIASYRTVLLENTWPEWSSYLGPLMCCLGVLFFAVSLFRKFDSKYPRMVLQ